MKKMMISLVAAVIMACNVNANAQSRNNEPKHDNKARQEVCQERKNQKSPASTYRVAPKSHGKSVAKRNQAPRHRAVPRHHHHAPVPPPAHHPQHCHAHNDVATGVVVGTVAAALLVAALAH